MADPIYTLPDLAYDYGALEPHLSAEIVTLHHDKHHQTYVDGANTALEKLAEARDKDDFSDITKLEKDLAFNLSGHILHSLYWQNLGPEGGDPAGEILEQINTDFGGFDKFRAQVTSAASTVQGSGWALAVWEPVGQRLVVTQLFDHQDNLMLGSLPVLAIDAWEHAWYLQYKNVKAEYFEAIWNIINWDDVASKLKAAKATPWSI